MVDCPEKLHSGADLLISLSVYMLPEAFKSIGPSSKPKSSRDGAMWFNEGKETEEEHILRDRKAALEVLFKTIGLQPRMEGSAAQDKENASPGHTSVPVDVKGKGVDRSTNVVDVDEEDEDILSENELDVIYRRYV